MKKIIVLCLAAALGAVLTGCALTSHAETLFQEPETVRCPNVGEAVAETETKSEQQTEPVSERVTGHGTTAEGLRAYYGIDGTYRETADAGIDGYTTYYYEKVDANGVVNIYDALSVVVDNETQEVFTYHRFDHPAFIEPVISEAAAREAAQAAYGQYGEIQDCRLEYYMPAYPDGAIYLAYTVTFADEYARKAYVDSQNGVLLGEDQFK